MIWGMMKRSALAVILLPVLLGGCEPERGIRADGNFPARVDVDCVDRTLRETFGQVQRWDYVSDGGRYTEGTSVVQFAYYSTLTKNAWATLEIGPTKTGTRISHSFTGIGAELSQTSFPPALQAMETATEALRKACHVEMSGMEMREIGQDVDALD